MEHFAVPPLMNAFAPRRGEHSSSDWEGLRDRITQLYSVQNKSLVELMNVMETEHGFLATYAYFNTDFLSIIIG